MSYKSEIAAWQTVAAAKSDAQRDAQLHRDHADACYADGDIEGAKEALRMAAAYDLNARAIQADPPPELIFSQRELNYMNSKPSIMNDPRRRREFMNVAARLVDSGVPRDSKEFYETMEHKISTRMQDLVLPTPDEAVEIAFGGSKYGGFNDPGGKVNACDTYNEGVRRLQDLKRTDPDRYGGN